MDINNNLRQLLVLLQGQLGAGGAGTSNASQAADHVAPTQRTSNTTQSQSGGGNVGMQLVHPAPEEQGGATGQSGAEGVVPPTGETPAPAPDPQRSSGTLKAVAAAAKGSAKDDLRRAQAVHNALKDQKQTPAEVRERIAGQRRFMALIAVRSTYNRVRVLHTVAKYTCPLGDESVEPHNGKIIAFSGDRVGRREPPSVELPPDIFEEVEVATGSDEKIAAHFNRENAPPVIPREQNEADESLQRTSKAILWPTEWLDMVTNGPTVWELLQLVDAKTKDWERQDLQHTEYIQNWCRAAMYANKKSGEASKRSALGVDMPLLETKTENLADWEDGELERSLGAAPGRIPLAAAQQGLHNLGLQQPIVQLQMPQQTLSALDAAYLRGVTTGQNATQTNVPSTSGYSSEQMAQLMGYMGLTARQRDQVPEIWTKGLDKAKTWVDAQRILNAAMQRLKCREEEVEMFFCKETAEDVWKLKLAFSNVPSAETVHRGITLFSFAGASQEQETASKLAEEALDAANNTTPADHKAAKARKKLGPPTTFRELMDMLKQYVVLGRYFFGNSCVHFENVNDIRMSLRVYARSNGNFMAKHEIADLAWAIVTDACQFFATISTEEDVATGPTSGGLYPKSILQPMVSLAAANHPIVMRNTPAAWKTRNQQRPGAGGGIGALAGPLGGPPKGPGRSGGGTNGGGRRTQSRRVAPTPATKNARPYAPESNK